MAFYEFVLQQDNVQNITIHQIKILNYNLHNPLTIKINLNEKRGSTYSIKSSSVLKVIFSDSPRVR